jgi:hypothetical protein
LKEGSAAARILFFEKGEKSSRLFTIFNPVDPAIM